MLKTEFNRPSGRFFFVGQCFFVDNVYFCASVYSDIEQGVIKMERQRRTFAQVIIDRMVKAKAQIAEKKTKNKKEKLTLDELVETSVELSGEDLYEDSHADYFDAD